MEVAMKVLIADDESVSRLRVRRFLSSLGHEPVEACDGREAWEAFQRQPFSLLIVDWMMPQINGLELCRMVRGERRSKYTYIIMLTALDGKGSYLEGIGAGADDFITKPFDSDELQARLGVAQRILSLQDEVRQLQGLLPICSYCKRINDTETGWVQIERYVARRTDASFTHGICPDCYAGHVRPQLVALREAKR
jgi:DNA-binding response OmpR family regulator